MKLAISDRLGPGIALDDLEVVRFAVMLRLSAEDAEAARVERLRELLWAASVLTRALSTHMQHSLVNCCGSLGTSNLAVETVDLHRALTRYSELVRVVAADYRPIVRVSGEPLHDDARPLHGDRSMRLQSAEVA